MMRPPALAGLLALGSCLWIAAAAPAAEPAPKQGTSLLFRKSLFIHDTPRGKVFVETRTAQTGETLARVLAAEYGISPEATGPLIEAFRELNPGVDPDRFSPGQVVRIPFKLEETVGSTPDAQAVQVRTVRRGENLWRILRGLGVTKERMGAALTAVAKANPELKDLNHVVPGQQLRLPQELGSGRSGSPPAAVPLLGLLAEVGCEVSARGEYQVALARGRSVRLDARDFPLITGPSGRRVVLDPQSRMSPALTRAVEGPWGVSVVRGRERDPEKEAERLLPRLGFHELAEGPRTASLGRDLELRAEPKYTLVPRAADLWEGKVHLLFGAAEALDADAAALAAASGFAVHALGGAVPAPAARLDTAPELAMADAAVGAAVLLRALGVPHRVREEVECELDGGIHYRLRPELAFEWGGLSYAVPPAQPARAAAMLERGGYLVWRPEGSALDGLRDLLLLLEIPHVRGWVEVPAGSRGLQLRVQGLTVTEPKLERALNPGAEPAGKVLLTQASLPPEAVRLLRGQGILPWVVRTRPSPP